MGNKLLSPIRLPKWNELSEIELYMDQVVGFIDKKLETAFGSDSEKLITSTMINNYVKQKLILPPEKKKYNRSQVATLIIVFILKRIYSIPEIADFLSVICEKEDIETAYDRFGDVLYSVSSELSDMSGGKSTIEPFADVMTAAVYALCARTYAKNLLMKLKPFSEKKSKSKDKSELHSKKSDKLKSKPVDFQADGDGTYSNKTEESE